MEGKMDAPANIVLPPTETSDTAVADDEQAPGTPSINNEIEEGELPSEDFGKPPSPVKFFIPFSICDGELDSHQQQLSALRKPVFGKEKAKQRLKALGIQKKIQMESRNQTTPKRSLSKPGADSGLASSSGSGKKDKKLMSPHEKAQLTINEIEVMKREEERGKVPVYYNESMIHRITADSYDDSKRSASLAAMTALPASIEAIKTYDDGEHRGEERKRKRAKPEAYRRRRRSTSSPFSSRRKLKFKRDRNNGQGSSRDRRRSSRKPRRETVSLEIRPEMRISGPEERLTRTRPVISYRFNPLASARKLKKKSKSRKKGKRKHALKDSQATEGEVQKEKRKKKRRPSDGKAGGRSASQKKQKKKSKKSSQTKKPAGVLSFVIDDLNFEEEVDDFPLSKEGFNPTSDSEEQTEQLPTDQGDKVSPQDANGEEDPKAENVQNFASPTVPGGETEDFMSATNPAAPEVPIDDKSPDTDDYMPNWEEEDDDDSDKFETAEAFLRKDQTKFASSNDDAYSSTEETTPESIKDGLGTPIFVNPSPPEEGESLISRPADGSRSISDRFKLGNGGGGNTLSNDNKDSDEEESLTPPIVQPKHLFEMENIYEQFLRSVREDPDFKDISSQQSSFQEVSPYKIPESESGFLSETSLLQTSSVTSFSSKSSNSSTSTSPRTSGSNDSSDTESSEMLSSSEIAPEVSSENDNEKYTEAKPIQNIASSETDDLSNISPEDLKKLRSVQKRHGMLKWIRQQIDGMDEEDRQCLLGLEKLIRAERQLLLRNDSIKRLHEQKNILGTDSEDSRDTSSNGSKDCTGDNETKCDTAGSNFRNIKSKKLNEHELFSVDEENGKFFDGKREAIKLTITNHSPMKKLSKQMLLISGDVDKAIADDDQDFTERLMKAKDRSKSSPSRSEEKASQRSSKHKERHGRSLSISPMRRSKKSPARARKSSRKGRQAYSPSPRRASSSRRKLSKSRRSGSSTRSSHSRRSSRRSRSTASASPTQSRSSSRSPSRSPMPGKEGTTSPTDGRVLESYPVWNIDRYSQYYIGDSYYYPRIPSGASQSDEKQVRYPTAYHEYAPYNMYANEYMNTHPNYDLDYSQHAASDYPGQRRQPSVSSPSDPYLRIPVIGSASLETADGYFYKNEFEDPAEIGSQNTTILHPEASNSSKPFAVQKGNVLEIVPAATISEVFNAVTIKQEAIDVDIKQEPIDNEDLDALQKLLDEERILSEQTLDSKVDIKTARKGHSWKNEVARRHVVSAVMRLNKETEDSPRGILKCRGNSTLAAKDKKKVLFADGIPPGRTSSASSDEESTLKLIRKRLKKTERRMRSENKENEIISEASDLKRTVLAKPDPELWDAPPPPPPPGSPPPHLPQPSLIRPTSPEELLYFHYDAVYNMMYVSPMENAIPPRLLQNNAKSAAKAQEEGTESGEGIPDANFAGMKASSSSPIQVQDNCIEEANCSVDAANESTDQKPVIVPSPETQRNDASTPPLPPPLEQKSETPPPVLPLSSSPPQPIQNIVSMRMSNSPLLFMHDSSSSVASSPSSFEATHPPQTHSPQHQPPRPQIPIMVGYPGQIFNRMQNRRTSPNIVRGPYNILPPPHSRAFNPTIPPPFHQTTAMNGLPPPNYDGPTGMPPMSPANGPHPPPTFSPNMMIYNSPQQQQLPPPHPLQHPPRPQGYGYGMGPHMMLSRPTGRFPSIPPPVPIANFLHADRKGSPRMGSHVFRHHPPLPLQSPSQNQPSTPPPGNPYS